MSIDFDRPGGYSFFSKLTTGLIISGLFLAAALAFTGCDRTKTETGAAAPAPARVVVAEAQNRPVPQTYTFSGTLSAKETVEVRARVSGYLAERLFEEGSQVEAGQVLYRIDDRDFKAALDTARANTAKAKAAWENDEANRGRFLTLAARGAISQAQRDQAVAQADESRAAYQAAQADEEKAGVNLGYATIVAPTSGFIGRSLVEVGGNVDASNSTLLTTIYNVDPIRAEFSISDKEYADFRRTLMEYHIHPEELRFDLALGDDRTPYSRQGKLEMADPVIDSRTNTMGVRVEFPNPEHSLRPGMYVNLTAALKDVQALTVPEVAVIDQATSKAVYVVNDDNTLAAVPVTVGRLVGDNRVITSGLAAGQKVVVEGLVTARPGLAVTVVDQPPVLAAGRPEPAPAAGQGPAAAPSQTAPANSQPAGTSNR